MLLKGKEMKKCYLGSSGCSDWRLIQFLIITAEMLLKEESNRGKKSSYFNL